MFSQNNLSTESSAYLLQHKNNPVWWQTWNQSALDFAKEQNKLLIISIGYSSCHWCHVMEHECFEDEEVASIMNQHFVCIKIDREERPDLDNVFMNAVQTMGIQGGWPLNVIAFPNGEPFFGGTYFPKDKWIAILSKIQSIHRKNSSELQEIATNVSRRLTLLDENSISEQPIFPKENIAEAIQTILQQIDRNWGGFSKAPKFPMPNAWKLMMQFAHQTKDIQVEILWKKTLERMMFGGIFDVVSGGFSRYSVDPYWKVPHFEKMLYDNAQLLSLYATAYKITKDNNYKELIEKTIRWLEEDMYSEKHRYFYAAMDADSEGEEGNYYVWKTSELKTILEHRYEFFANIYNVEQFGLWEHDKNILIQLESDEVLATKMKLDVETFQLQKKECLALLKIERKKRIKPFTDTKCVVSWNALLITAFCECYQATEEAKYLHFAEDILQYIESYYVKNQALSHCIYPEKEEQELGFLEDYAFVIQATITLYESTFDSRYLHKAKQLTDETLHLFYHRKKQLFAQKSLNEDVVLTDFFPIYDSVEPSANAIMCENLFKLSYLFSDESYLEISHKMIQTIQNKAMQFPLSFTQWISVMYYVSSDFYEIAILGKDAILRQKELNSHYIPNKIIAGSTSEEYLPIMKNRLIENQTLLYICKGKSCYLPEETVENVLKKLT